MKWISSVIFLFSSFLFSQSNEGLKTEIEQIKSDITFLKKEIAAVKSENVYLKNQLDIQRPVLLQKIDNLQMTLTKVVGNTKEKTIALTLMLEALNENQSTVFKDFSVVDIAGNEYKIDLYKSSPIYPKLTKGVPLKIIFTFKECIDEPKFIKLFRVRSTNQLNSSPRNETNSYFEFRDLNVQWD